MVFRVSFNRLLAASTRSSIGVTPNASMSSKTPGPPVPTKLPLLERFWPFTKTLTPINQGEEPIENKNVKFPSVIDGATGEEKLLLLAFENGILDPYDNLPTSREGKGTKDNPIIIESFFPDRLVACVCEPEQTFHRFTNVYLGEKKRCSCGYWMELREAPRFWEKIPKESLLEITFFRDLEEQGLLDDYLGGKHDEVLEKLEAQGGDHGGSH